MQGHSQGPGVVVAIIGTALLALYTSTSILTGGGNTLADFFFYTMVGLGVLGALAPRLTFWVFLVLCAVLDLMKRLLIFGGSIEFVDLFWVLGVAPVAMCGIVFGLVMRILFGKITADFGDVRRLAGAVLLNVILAAYMVAKGGGIGGTLRQVANSSCYAVLLFVVPLLFRSPQEIIGCLRAIILIFVPVALYGVYQQTFGFLPFELDYLKTGLSIEIKQLEADRVRAFSTLNSPPSLSVVCCSLAAYVCTISFSRARELGRGFATPVALLLVMTFLAGWMASTARSGIILVPVALLGALLFQSKRGVRLFYGLSIGSFVSLVLLSPILITRIFVWTDALVSMTGGSQFFRHVLNMNSYVDRLQGFANVLMNPQAYTLFGLGDPTERSTAFYNHDPVSEALLSYGVVGLVLGTVVGGVLLWRIHEVVVGMKHPVLRALAAACLANAAGSVAVSLLNGNLLGVYPINVFFWSSIAFTVALRRCDDVVVAELRRMKAAPPAADVASQAPDLRVHPGRFAPVPRPVGGEATA